MSTLYILCGIPGSGKSTWASKMVDKYGENQVAWISRDKIRFELLTPEEDYFSHEDEVKGIFIKNIQGAIWNKVPFVIADASHLNDRSRQWLLERLELEDTKIRYVYFDIPLEIALERNARRSGRALVPETAILNMWHALTPPKGITIVVNERNEEREIYL